MTKNSHSTTKLLTQEKPKITNNPNDAFESVLFLPKRKNRQDEGGLRAQGYFKKSYENKPLISIITVVFNGAQFLEKTINSIINQTYGNVEYIIIDGGSTDGTVDIIKKYEDNIDYWVSESDGGIYDAMNKGIQLSFGHQLNFMNEGDNFADYHILDNFFSKFNHKVILYGNQIENENIYHPLNIKKLRVGKIHACHQSMFFNKDILKNTLAYDLRYKIYADYELVNRIYLKHPKFIHYIDIVIANFLGGGISSKISSQKRKDKYLILLRSYGIFGLVRGLMHRLLFDRDSMRDSMSKPKPKQ